MDRATGREYRRVPGAPLLAVGSESTRGISTWFIAGGSIIFLEPDDYPREMHGPVGHVYGQQLTPEDRGPELRIY